MLFVIYNKRMQRGYLAISSILIISAVVLAITISVSYLSIGEGQSSLALYKGENTLSFIEGCMEDALLKIRSNPLYNGTTIMHNGETCTITVVNGGGGNYTLTATTTDTSYIRTVQVVVNRDYSITMTSWKEQ